MISRLGLTAKPISWGAYWQGIGVLVGIVGFAVLLVQTFAGFGSMAIVYLVTHGAWLILAPWIVRHYTNRMISVGWWPVVAPIGYLVATACLLLGVAWIMAPSSVGLPQYEELGALIVPLVFGWTLGSFVWAVFTLALGSMPTACGREATSP